MLNKKDDEKRAIRIYWWNCGKKTLDFNGTIKEFFTEKNIKRVLDAELYFYSKVFGFELPDAIEPVRIENLNS